MFTKNQFQTLFAYHWHTTDKILDCAGEQEGSQLHVSPEYSQHSIHETLFHLLQTDRGWRLGLESGRQLAGIKIEDFPDLDTLRTGFESEKAAWDVLLGDLAEEQITADIELTSWRGEVMTFSYWRILQHLILHGMQHHSELAQMLTHQGCSPGDIDFIFFRW